MALPRWHIGVSNRLEVRAVGARNDRSSRRLHGKRIGLRGETRSDATTGDDAMGVDRGRFGNMVRDAGGGGFATGIVSTATRRLAGTPNVCPTIIILSRVVLRHSRDTCAI